MPHDPNALTPVIDRRRAAETRIMAADEREKRDVDCDWFVAAVVHPSACGTSENNNNNSSGTAERR